MNDLLGVAIDLNWDALSCRICLNDSEMNLLDNFAPPLYNATGYLNCQIVKFRMLHLDDSDNRIIIRF